MTDDLIWQFDLAWALAELHLGALHDDDFLWEPVELTWSVHPGADGVWRPDFAETEPDPIPVPTIGWLTWHIICPPQAGGAPRWTATVDKVTGATPRGPADVPWPGDGATAVTRIRELAAQWREYLRDAPDLRTALWLNFELTKNITEIGQLRLMRAAAAGI